MGTPGPHSTDRTRQYAFGDFTLDLDAGLLRRGAEEVTLRPKAFEVLVYLVERHGRLVAKSELRFSERKFVVRRMSRCPGVVMNGWGVWSSRHSSSV